MTFTLTPHGARHRRRHRLRHGARAHAAVSRSRRCRGFAAGYVNLIRSVPLVLVIFWFYFLVPYIGQWIPAPADPGRRLLPRRSITFTLFEAAYFCEIMRAGIQSIPRGQALRPQAVGMTYAQTMRYVILPQAFRNMLPVLLTQTHHPVPGHVAGLRALDHRLPRRRLQGRAARRAPGRDVPVRRRRLSSSSAHGLAGRAPASQQRTAIVR